MDYFEKDSAFKSLPHRKQQNGSKLAAYHNQLGDREVTTFSSTSSTYGQRLSQTKSVTKRARLPTLNAIVIETTNWIVSIANYTIITNFVRKKNLGYALNHQPRKTCRRPGYQGSRISQGLHWIFTIVIHIIKTKSNTPSFRVYSPENYSQCVRMRARSSKRTVSQDHERNF